MEQEEAARPRLRTLQTHQVQAGRFTHARTHARTRAHAHRRKEAQTYFVSYFQLTTSYTAQRPTFGVDHLHPPRRVIVERGFQRLQVPALLHLSDYQGQSHTRAQQTLTHTHILARTHLHTHTPAHPRARTHRRYFRRPYCSRCWIPCCLTHPSMNWCVRIHTRLCVCVCVCGCVHACTHARTRAHHV